jgi:hypothetical protein
MVERLVPALRRMDEDTKVLARRLLPDEFVEALRAQRGVSVLTGALGSRDSGGISGHKHLETQQLQQPYACAHMPPHRESPIEACNEEAGVQPRGR